MASRGPDLKKYMDKRLSLSLNGSRKVEGTLRGYDQFMNVVLDNTVEQLANNETKQIGMVVIRGNSITQMEIMQALAA